jgi:hypothetical protein
MTGTAMDLTYDLVCFSVMMVGVSFASFSRHGFTARSTLL